MTIFIFIYNCICESGLKVAAGRIDSILINLATQADPILKIYLQLFFFLI